MSGPKAGAPLARSRHPLHPAGTAHATFLSGATPATGARAPGGAVEYDDPLPRSSWEQLRARDVPAATLLAAWEAARWLPPGTVSVDERRALAVLLVAVGEAVDAGSSFLPLSVEEMSPSPSPSSQLPWRAWLDRSGLPSGERSAVVSLAGALAAGRAPAALASLFGAPNARRPFVLDGAALYPEAAWTFEARLARALEPRQDEGPDPLGPGTDDALAGLRTPAAGPTPNSEQLAALRACLDRRLTLITGGPGTGKTSIIVGLLRALARLDVRPAAIAVAAPTGRAAHRIEETLRQAGLSLGDGWTGVSTVHRLLGLRGTRLPTLERETPEYHADWRLPHRVVVCDEASMIDLFMMTALTEALADDAHLVLLGDVDQLPSVRLGAAFRDLCLALPALTHHLSTSHRMNPADPGGAEILGVAAAVRAGALAGPLPARTRAADLTFTGVEHLPRARVPELLDRWYEEVLGGPAAFEEIARRRVTLDERGGLDPADGAAVTAALERHRAARLLCITRAADHVTSAEAVNAFFHQRVERVDRTGASSGAGALDGDPDDPNGPGALGRQSATTVAGTSLGAGPIPVSVFLPGEPVTILRNDYERELWNGDQGLVIRLAPAPAGPSRPAVAFARGNGVVVHLLDEIADNVALAFALTVHKAQGSEYERVALILPSVDGPLLTREILYTALTRARRGVVVAGDPALFARGVSRRLGRASGLASKLRGTAPGR